VYYNEFVKPIHRKQKQEMSAKLKKEKQQMSYNTMLKMRNSINGGLENADISIYKNIEEKQLVNVELEKKVKSLKISDYFKTKKLQIKSTLKKKAEETKRKGFMNQIKTMNQSITSDAHLVQNESSIFHTDQKKLKNEFIDQDKAISLLKDLKLRDKDYESKNDLIADE
jgi:hypothetical protein